MSYTCEKCGYKHYESKGAKYKDHWEFRKKDASPVKPVVPPVPSMETIREMETRTVFHKYNEHGLVDRVIESVAAPDVGKIKNGQPVKKHKILKWLN